MAGMKKLFDDTRALLRGGDAKNPLVVAVSSQCQGKFNSKASIRDFNVTFDQPNAFGGENAGPKPSEMLLAALAACQEVTYRLYADGLSIPLDGVRVELTGLMDLNGFLGVDDNVSAGFQEIRGTVHLDSSASDADLERLRQEVEKHCPVLDDLRRPVDVEIVARRETKT